MSSTDCTISSSGFSMEMVAWLTSAAVACCSARRSTSSNKRAFCRATPTLAAMAVSRRICASSKASSFFKS
jgi:hypothetical protein